MKMKPFGMSALALLGALLLGTGQVQASETLNTILGGGAGGVAGTMIGKELGGDTGALVASHTTTRGPMAPFSWPWSGQGAGEVVGRASQTSRC